MEEHNEDGAAHPRQLVLPVLSPDGRPLPAQLLAERLSAVAGVRHAYVSAQTEMAWLIYDGSCLDLAELASALAACGYTTGAPELRDAPPGWSDPRDSRDRAQGAARSTSHTGEPQ